MASYFRLGFGTNLSKTATINIRNPKPNVSEDTVKDVMDEIIDLNIIDFTAGIPVSRKSAVIVTKTEKEIPLS